MRSVSGKYRGLFISLLGITIVLFGYVLFNKFHTPAAGTTRIHTQDGMTQVYIPSGAFTMGAAESALLAECQKYRTDCQPGFYLDMEPAHLVTLDAFWIDQTEVTNAMYAQCVAAGSCQKPVDLPLFGAEEYFNNPRYVVYPVRNVTFADARTYCAWAGRRLPSEAEWEKAARGTDGRLYPWGDEPATGERGNYCDRNCPRSYRDLNGDDGYVDTSPVGSYPAGASPYGVLDLAGNVREWTASLYLPYPYQSDSGREDWDSTGNRVVRGSHWDGTADFALSAYRFEDFPDYQSTCVGFRCASSQ